MAKCKICKKEFVQYNTIQNKCIECAIKKAKEIEHKKAKQTFRVEKKEMQIKVENWNKNTVVKIQHIARLIDHLSPCLARGFTNCQFHGGHVFSKSSSSNIKHNLHNIFAQSAQSNHWQNDDALMREGVVNEFGIEYMTFIKELKKTPTPKLSNIEWHERYEKCLAIINRLKKINNGLIQKRSSNERIRLRNEINTELAIYDLENCIFNPNEI